MSISKSAILLQVMDSLHIDATVLRKLYNKPCLN